MVQGNKIPFPRKNSNEKLGDLTADASALRSSGEKIRSSREFFVCGESRSFRARGFLGFITQGFRPGLKEVAPLALKICSRQIKSQEKIIDKISFPFPPNKIQIKNP